MGEAPHAVYLPAILLPGPKAYCWGVPATDDKRLALQASLQEVTEQLEAEQRARAKAEAAAAAAAAEAAEAQGQLYRLQNEVGRVKIVGERAAAAPALARRALHTAGGCFQASALPHGAAVPPSAQRMANRPPPPPPLLLCRPRACGWSTAACWTRWTP